VASRRDLALLVGAVGVSAAGDFLVLVPLALHIEETTDSGPAVAALAVHRRIQRQTAELPAPVSASVP
jgi:hypothetical protein